MDPSARDGYLATEVTTASPQKLQLMLIEGALRLAGRAKQLWRRQQDVEASGALLRAQEIAGELLAALDREAQPALAAQAAGVYLFLFRCLLEADLQRDEAKLNDAIRVLEVERETWRQVCETMGAARPDAATSWSPAPAPPPMPLVDPMPGVGAPDAFPIGGFSLEV